MWRVFFYKDTFKVLTNFFLTKGNRFFGGHQFYFISFHESTNNITDLKIQHVVHDLISWSDE
jgi:hypothetical protein